MPGRDKISEQTYSDYPELAKDAGAASVTEMEILHALVDPLHRGKPPASAQTAQRYERVKYAFFYLREHDYLAALPADLPQLRQIYTNEGIEEPEGRCQSVREQAQRMFVQVKAAGFVRPWMSYKRAELMLG